MLARELLEVEQPDALGDGGREDAGETRAQLADLERLQGDRAAEDRRGEVGEPRVPQERLRLTAEPAAQLRVVEQPPDEPGRALDAVRVMAAHARR